jgi:nitrous oxidase accessory protein
VSLAVVAVAAGAVDPAPVDADAASGGDLQAMIDEAGPGATVTVPPGVYRGPIVLDEPVTLVGEGRPVIDSGGHGHVIEVTSPDVSIEGFVLRGSGRSLASEDAGVMALESDRVRVVDNRFEDVLFGVFLKNARDAVVEDNVVGAKDLPEAQKGDGIRVYGSDRSQVRRNVVVGGRDLIVWFAHDVVLEQNEIRNGRYGAHFMYADRGVVRRNRFEGNSIGVFLMFSHDTLLEENVMAGAHGPSGVGLGFKDCDATVVRGNRIVDNEVGIRNDGSPFSAGAVVRFERNLVSANDVGVELMPSVHDNVFTENAFVGNRHQVAVTGGGQPHDLSWAVDGRGNHWSDYAGYDADGDGVGDVEYRAEDLFGDLIGEYPELEMFADTPAARALDVASRTFPVLRPEPRAVDPSPLVDLPDIPPPLGEVPEGRSAPMGAVALAMVALAASLMRGALRRRGPAEVVA